jgi:hypothetical protein
VGTAEGEIDGLPEGAREGVLLVGELGISLGLPDGANGVFVGLSEGPLVGPLVAPNSVGSILT